MRTEEYVKKMLNRIESLEPSFAKYAVQATIKHILEYNADEEIELIEAYNQALYDKKEGDE